MKLLLTITLSFLLSVFFLIQTEKPTIILTKQNIAKNYNNNFLSFISLGNKRMISDWFYIQTLIESDLEHYKGNDKNNWMYLRFNTILDLDPNFLQAYQYGGQYLSIIKDDDLGAKDIYDRGLKVYPDDYFLNFNAGFHYLYELGDLVKGKELYSKIMFHPRAPKNLATIVARIDAGNGDNEVALKLLIENFKLNQGNQQINQEFLKTLEESAEALQVEIDLECLNSKKGNCRTSSYRGIPYSKNANGQYTYPIPIESFRLKKNKRNLLKRPDK